MQKRGQWRLAVHSVTKSGPKVLCKMATMMRAVCFMRSWLMMSDELHYSGSGVRADYQIKT